MANKNGRIVHRVISCAAVALYMLAMAWGLACSDQAGFGMPRLRSAAAGNADVKPAGGRSRLAAVAAQETASGADMLRQEDQTPELMQEPADAPASPTESTQEPIATPVPSSEPTQEAAPASPSEPTNTASMQPMPGRAGIAPYSIDIIDTSSVVVYTFDELKSALNSKNGYTTVYLGSDIQIASLGIAISSSKTSLIIDGINPLRPEDGRHKIAEYNSIDYGNTIRVPTTGLKDVTLRNLVIDGKNYYGTVCVPDGTNNVILTYENVDYTGPQITYNRGGTARYMDKCKIIDARSVNNCYGEIAEANKVVLGGNLYISHAESTLSCFWLTNAGTSFEVLPNANVTLESTGRELFYADGGTCSIFIGAHAAVNVTTAEGLFYGTGAALHQASGITIQTGAQLIIHQLRRSGRSVATIRCGGNIKIEPHAVLEITASHASADPLIQFVKTGLNILADNPKGVMLYNKTGKTVNWAAGSGSMIMNAQQINYWSTVDDLPQAGSLGDMPAYAWKKINGENISVTTTSSSSAMVSVTHNFTPDVDEGSAPSNTTFNVPAAHMITLGTLPLDIFPLNVSSRAISGVTAPLASLKAEYAQNGNVKTLYMTADADGVYGAALPGADALEAQSEVVVTGNWRGLTTQTKAIVDTLAPDTLAFVAVPPVMDFETIALPPGYQLIQRSGSVWYIAIMDTRAAGKKWAVYASVQEPLHVADRPDIPPLPDALVFIDESGTRHVLGSQDTSVFFGVKGAESEPVLFWPQAHGIMIELFGPQAFCNVPYTATILWTLADVP